MSQITTKWIEDGAITPVKVDTAGYFFVHGIDATHAKFIDATIANMAIGGAVFQDATVTNLSVESQFQTWDATALNNLVVGGDTSITGNTLIGGNASITGDALIGGNASITGDLFVHGIDATHANFIDATTLNNLVVGGDAAITGDAVIGGNATVTGDLFVSTTGGTGIRLIGRNTNDNFVEVDGDLFLDTSSATVQLYQDSTTVQINGDTTVSGGFYGTGNALIGGDATVTGNLLVSTTGGTGIRLIGRNTNDNYVVVNGDLFIDTASATVHLYQDSTTVQINGDTTVSGGFYGTGNALIGGDATVGRGLKVRGPMSVTTGTHDATLFGNNLTFDRDNTDHLEIGYANSAINCTREVSNLSIVIDTTRAARFWSDRVELNLDASIGNAYFGGQVGINSSLSGTSRLIVADLNGNAINGWINDGGLGTGILGRAAGEPYVAQSRSMAGVFFGDTSVTKDAYVNGRMTSKDASFGSGGAICYEIITIENWHHFIFPDKTAFFIPTNIPSSGYIIDSKFSYDETSAVYDPYTRVTSLKPSYFQVSPIRGAFMDATVYATGDFTTSKFINKKLFVTYVV